MLKNEIKGVEKGAQETETKATISYLITAAVFKKKKRAKSQVKLQYLLKSTRPKVANQTGGLARSLTHSLMSYG